jgi:hypothetical protein
MFRLHILWIVILSSGLIACGGGDDVIPQVASSPVDDSVDNSVDNSVDDDSSTFVEKKDVGVTYIPLQFYLSGEGYVEDGGVFAGIGFSPLVQGYVISPVSGADLSPLEAPDVSDYKITINDENVGGDEQGLIMQKIIGLPINLHTAIVIDTSSSNSKASGVDIEALILEVKNFVAEAQSSPDMTIANQQFTLWAYASAGSGVQALVPNFTTSAVIMDNALDSLLVGDVWEERGADSATYEAIVKAVGIYVGQGSGGASENVDLLNDGIDDLVEGYQYNNSGEQLVAVNLANVVLVSRGQNTNYQTFFKDDAKAALQWQSIIGYVEESVSDNIVVDGGDAVTNSETVLINKPLIYVSVGPDGPDELIGQLASNIIDTASNDAFDFSGSIIEAQKEAVDIRTQPDNQYLIRYAMFERDGQHELKLESNSLGYNYSLVTDFDMSNGLFLGIPDIAPTVEIAGPENAYLPSGFVSLRRVNRLYPQTRWAVQTFEGSDYSWTVGGVSRAAEADGSIVITSADIGDAVILSNDSLSGGNTSAALTVSE